MPLYAGSVAAPTDIPGLNIIQNAGMMVNQRGMSATSVADDAYCLDRWYVLTQTATIQVSQQTQQDSMMPTNMRLTQNQAAAQRMGTAQIVEASKGTLFRTQAVTLSARIRCSAAQAIRYAILEWTGAVDTVTSDVVADWTNASFTAGAFFLAANLTVTAVGSTTPTAAAWTDISLTGTCGASFNNLVVFIWTEGTAAQNVTLDVAKVKLERGSTATQFADWNYDVELYAAQRHFYTVQPAASGWIVRIYMHRSGTNWYGMMPYNAVMRVAPTLTWAASAGYTNAAPGANQVALYDLVAGAYITITGALTLAGINSTIGSELRMGAATSWSGTDRDFAQLYCGAGAVPTWSADL